MPKRSVLLMALSFLGVLLGLSLNDAAKAQQDKAQSQDKAAKKMDEYVRGHVQPPKPTGPTAPLKPTQGSSSTHK